MHCMKCGQKIEDSKVFCPNCLEDMEKYPVRPGTVVRLPQHSSTPVEKKRARRRPTFWKSADQITMLRTRVRWLTVALIVTFICFLGAAFLVMWLLEWHKYIDLPRAAAYVAADCFT